MSDCEPEPNTTQVTAATGLSCDRVGGHFCPDVSSDDDEMTHLLGALFLQRGDAEQAVQLLAGVTNRGRRFPDLHFHLGVAWEQLGQLQAAWRAYEQGLTIEPEHLPMRQQLLGLLARWSAKLIASNNYAMATTCYERLVELRPADAQVWSNLSYLYERIGDTDSAIAAAQQGLQNAADLPELHNNLGVAFRSAHRLTMAQRSFSQAVSLRPEFELARFNQGSLQLLNENYPAGWIGYESRAGLADVPEQLAELPRWDGRPLLEGRLLVYCDQGFGDAIQFARFLPQLKQRCRTQLVLQVPRPLIELFTNSCPSGPVADAPWADEVVADDVKVGGVSAVFPLSSAGHLLQLGIEQLTPASWPMQLNEPVTESDSEFANILPNPPATQFRQPKIRVGLVWRGNSQQDQDHVRSMRLAQLERFSQFADVDWFSLQVDADAAELAAWPAPLTDWGTRFSTFADTARQLLQLDLLITVDTATAHLAGSMGLAVWTMLAHTPDWRWHLHRADSPWYPTMRLYRQPAWGDWDSVVTNVVSDLQRWCDQHGSHAGTVTRRSA